jgi:RecB family endonuclease NucS
MRVVVARCSVVYTGRLSSRLDEAVRLLLVKADGSVLVHSDSGAYRPLNWMSPPCTLTESEGQWLVTSRSGEAMTITIYEVLHDSTHPLGYDAGLTKDGVERQLQVLLAERTGVLEEGLTLVQREFPTGIGPVDLLCRDRNGTAVAVEIKRRAEIDGVEQLTRYLDRLRPAHPGIRGMLVATDVKPQARVLATDRGIACVVVDYDGLRGIESDRPTLF